MEKSTQRFLAAARDGRPVFIPEVRGSYAELAEADRLPVCLYLRCLNGDARRFALAMPRLGGHTDEERQFILDYVMAQVFNILSCLGGRELGLHFHESSPDNEPLLTHLLTGLGLGGNASAPEFGRYSTVVRVIDRMLAALYPDEKPRFALDVPAEPPVCREPVVGPETGAETVLRRASEGLEGRVLLGMDIGGTDIKLALSVGGRLVGLKEYDWFPSVFTGADEFIRPLVVLTRLMSACAASGGPTPALAEAMKRTATLAVMEEALRNLPEAPAAFDGIALSFPDVVVGDRVVGGESPKTLGMREALGKGYEAEFARLTALREAFTPWVRGGGRNVFIINDGPMAAFTAGVELAAERPEAVARGIFAHSLGTDFGTGWVTAAGEVPDIPLEVYACMLDLGSYPERAYPADDIRSINNFNNNLPGTMQKFAGQSGVFRLAQKYLPDARPDLYREILANGFIVEHNPPGAGEPAMLAVPTRPRDMRKPFLEHMMSLASRGDCPEAAAIFREIGRAIGMSIRECDWILVPGLKRRTLFGRLVKVSACFDLIREGVERVDSRCMVEAADDNMARTPLMRDLSFASGYTVAQFGQAVGAVYYANLRLGTE